MFRQGPRAACGPCWRGRSAAVAAEAVPGALPRRCRRACPGKPSPVRRCSLTRASRPPGSSPVPRATCPRAPSPQIRSRIRGCRCLWAAVTWICPVSQRALASVRGVHAAVLPRGRHTDRRFFRDGRAPHSRSRRSNRSCRSLRWATVTPRSCWVAFRAHRIRCSLSWRPSAKRCSPMPAAALAAIGAALAAFETEDPRFAPFSSEYDYWLQGEAS